MYVLRLSAAFSLGLLAMSCSDDEPEPKPDPEPSTFGFTVTLSGDGTGVIRSLDEQVSCSTGVCEYDVLEGTVLELVAEPANGSEFTGWGGHVPAFS